MVKKIFYTMVLMCVCVFGAYAKDAVLPISIDGDEYTFLRAEGKIVAKGNVRMKRQDTVITCDDAVYDTNADIAHLRGNVKIVQPKTTLYGDEVTYDFTEKKAHFVDVRFESEPMYGWAPSGDKTAMQEEYILKRGFMTTCDRLNPHYRFTARRILVYPKNKIIAKHVVMKIGKVPVFYLPYLSQSLKKRKFFVQLTPGSSKDWGNYLQSAWRYELTEGQRGKVFIDKYEKRGWGLGAMHKTETKQFGKGLVTYYSIQDKMYQLDKQSSLFEKYPDRSGTPAKYLEDDRYKAQMRYDWQATDRVSVTGEFNKFSDPYFMKDFFYPEYEKLASPASYVLVNANFTNSSLATVFQKRVNTYTTEVQYMPQMEYRVYPMALGDTNVYVESESRLGNLQKDYSYSAEETSVTRAYSHNTVSVPFTLAWLALKPYAGAYTAVYSRDVFGDRSVWRAAPHFGADMSVKMYRFFDEGINFLGLKADRLRHVFTPQLSYGYTHDPTITNGHIFQMDSFDALGKGEAVTLTLDNKVQAKRAERKWDMVYFSPAATYVIDQEGKGSYWSQITTNMEFYPVSTISVNGDMLYDVPLRRTTSANAAISIQHPEKNHSISLGQRYVRQSSTQGTFDAQLALTSKIQWHTYVCYEYNTGDINEQQQSARLDLHCWWLDVVYSSRRRDFGVGRNEYIEHGVMIIFTLKAFPELLGGFARTYNGTKQSY